MKIVSNERNARNMKDRQKERLNYELRRTVMTATKSSTANLDLQALCSHLLSNSFGVLCYLNNASSPSPQSLILFSTLIPV